MCGLVFAHGPNAETIVKAGLKKIAYRGPDEQKILNEGETCMGFVRLAINDQSDASMQPHEYGSLLGMFNAEIYNHAELKETLDCTPSSGSDTNVILPLFAQNRRILLQKLDGFFSGVIYDQQKRKLFTIRDLLGKKPLFLVKTGQNLVVTSELKSCSKIDGFQIIPRGICEIDLQAGSILQNNKNSQPYVPNKTILLWDAMVSAVNKRIPAFPPTKYAVFLSGGLDSSIIASLVHRSTASKNARYYYFDNDNSEDTKYAREILEYLQIPNNQIKAVPTPQDSEIGQLISDVVYHTESYNPSIISNGIGTYILSKYARHDDIKVALGGDGADEVFCGYFDHGPDDDWQTQRHQLLNDLHTTELRRIDGAAMAHSIEVRCPFLDRDVIHISDKLNYADLYGSASKGYQRKKILRVTFSDILPVEVSQRPKVSFDRGTGIQEQVINYCKAQNLNEQEYLKQVWRKHSAPSLSSWEDTPYFHSYPAFDKFIQSRARKYE